MKTTEAAPNGPTQSTVFLRGTLSQPAVTKLSLGELNSPIRRRESRDIDFQAAIWERKGVESASTATFETLQTGYSAPKACVSQVGQTLDPANFPAEARCGVCELSGCGGMVASGMKKGPGSSKSTPGLLIHSAVERSLQSEVCRGIKQAGLSTV